MSLQAQQLMECSCRCNDPLVVLAHPQLAGCCSPVAWQGSISGTLTDVQTKAPVLESWSGCVGEGKMFSPGNLRATFDNPAYERLLSHYIGEKYTLRYTGGMVPDVFQIIVKEKGVFTNVTSPSTKAKLRILFEVAPLALLVGPGSMYLPYKAYPFVHKHKTESTCFAFTDACI